jgi:hypothetical protein
LFGYDFISSSCGTAIAVLLITEILRNSIMAPMIIESEGRNIEILEFLS